MLKMSIIICSQPYWQIGNEVRYSIFQLIATCCFRKYGCTTADKFQADIHTFLMNIIYCYILLFIIMYTQNIVIYLP